MLHRGSRPKFDTIEEHDEDIIEKWNSVVGKNDLVYHLGDVAVGEDSSCLKPLHRCNGQKILILGNHDKLHISEYIPYFQNIHGLLKFDDCWLSHMPIHPQEFYSQKYNIHGHIHAPEKQVPDPRYICVAIDNLPGMKPISLEEITDNIRQKA